MQEENKDSGATANKSYSSTYWNLHRNSIIASLSLFLFSLPGVSLGKNSTILGIQLSQKTQFAIPFFMLAAAVYTLTVCYLEWRSEVLSRYTDTLKEYGDLKTRLKDSLETAIQPMDHYLSLLSQYTTSFDAIEKNFYQVAENVLQASEHSGFYYKQDLVRQFSAKIWEDCNQVRMEASKHLDYIDTINGLENGYVPRPDCDLTIADSLDKIRTKSEFRANSLIVVSAVDEIGENFKVNLSQFSSLKEKSKELMEFHQNISADIKSALRDQKRIFRYLKMPKLTTHYELLLELSFLRFASFYP